MSLYLLFFVRFFFPANSHLTLNQEETPFATKVVAQRTGLVAEPLNYTRQAGVSQQLGELWKFMKKLGMPVCVYLSF